MIKKPKVPKSATFSVLDVVAAILALAGLLPMAGGLASIASPAIRFADAGPALLLAAGLRLALRGIAMLWYISGYTFLLMVAGELRLWMTGFHRLASGWFVMALCIGIILLILRRFWLWAAVGGLWSALLLSMWVFGGIVAYMSASAALFPTLLVIQTVGAVMVFTVKVSWILHRYSDVLRLESMASIAQFVPSDSSEHECGRFAHVTLQVLSAAPGVALSDTARSAMRRSIDSRIFR